MNLTLAAVVAVCAGLDCPPQGGFYDPLTNDRLTLREEAPDQGRRSVPIDWLAAGILPVTPRVETRHSRLLAPRDRILGSLMFRGGRAAASGPETVVLLVAASGGSAAEFVSVGFYEGAGRGIVAGPLPRVVMPALRGIAALPPDPESRALRFGDLWSEESPDGY
ncbi:MAG: hypothetical protein RLZZ528_2431 [Pseudomonadota bacterium]|jgi:hypothetical protein